MTSRAMRSEQRKQRIIESATEAFAKHGYHNSSLKDIAAQVGISAPSLLHHFGTKEALLTAVLDARDSDSDSTRSRIERGVDEQLLQHLVETMRENTDRWGITQLYTVLSVESITTDHPARPYFVSRFKGLRQLIAKALLDEATELRDGTPPAEGLTDQYAAILIAAMDGLQIQWLLDPDEIDVPGSTALVIAALLEALKES